MKCPMDAGPQVRANPMLVPWSQHKWDAFQSWPIFESTGTAVFGIGKDRTYPPSAAGL